MYLISCGFKNNSARISRQGFLTLSVRAIPRVIPKYPGNMPFPSLHSVWAALTLLLYCLCSLQKLVYFLRTSLRPCTIQQIRKIPNHLPHIFLNEYFHHNHFLCIELMSSNISGHSIISANVEGKIKFTVWLKLLLQSLFEDV